MDAVVVFEYPPGATPLDLDEAECLIPIHIAIQGQLNEWEQNNILEAEKWLGRQRFQLAEVMMLDFVRE